MLLVLFPMHDSKPWVGRFLRAVWVNLLGKRWATLQTVQQYCRISIVKWPVSLQGYRELRKRPYDFFSIPGTPLARHSTFSELVLRLSQLDGCIQWKFPFLLHVLICSVGKKSGTESLVYSHCQCTFNRHCHHLFTFPSLQYYKRHFALRI